MTITDEQYADVIAALKRGDQTLGTIHVSRWCDGSTACAVETKPLAQHGHWRGGYTVDATEFVLRLLDEVRAATTAPVDRETALVLFRSTLALHGPPSSAEAGMPATEFRDLATDEYALAKGASIDAAIAAAPDLLAACGHMLDVIERTAHTVEREELDAVVAVAALARAAIAKAKGETT